MKTLNIQVLSGLGSRMRAVLAAVAWARAHDAYVRVCWPWKDRSEQLGEFPAWFSDLFDSPLDELRMPAPIEGRNWPQQPVECNYGWRARTCHPEHFGIESLDLSGWPYLELWKPSALVQEQVDSVEWPDGKVVGVHIRHSLAQPTTPALGWFLARMSEIRSRFGDVQFFLSTDSGWVEREVKTQISAFCQERSYAYDGLGIARAAADLFLLARCDWLIGSYNSSFSELAGWMRGGKYLHGWGRPGWMPDGRYEDAQTPPVGIKEALA